MTDEDIQNSLFFDDAFNAIKKIESESIELILSDIPYGISYDSWDVLHKNTNSALLGSSPAQKKAGAVFKSRGKPLNGWSKEDKEISKQYYEWCSSFASDWLRVLKTGASCFVFAGRRQAHRCICAFEDAGFIYKDMIAWKKDKAAHRAQHVSCVYEKREDMLSAERWKNWKLGNLRPVFEPILWFMKPYKIGGTLADNILENSVGAFNEAILKKYRQSSDNFFEISSQKSDTGLHPAQKPLELMKLLIELTTIKGQTVLDPFMGSGTVPLAAKELGRKFIGFEKEKIYYECACTRLKNSMSLFETKTYEKASNF